MAKEDVEYNWDKICSCIGQHARFKFQELNQESASNPLEFQAPRVYRGTRITVDIYDSKRGDYIQMKNLLVKRRRGLLGSQDYVDFHNSMTHQRSESESSYPEEVTTGYCIRKKIASTVYGGIYKGVVMKKRSLLLGETAVMRDKTKVKNKNSSGSLNRIVEDDILDNVTFEKNQQVTPRSGSGVWEATDQHVVIKASSWAKIRRLRGKHLEDPIKEIQAMQLLGDYHSNIATHIDAIQDDSTLYNVMQYCDEGDLYGEVMSEIHANGRVDENCARIWFRQLIVALYHLQQKGVCHNDLSLENIMVHQHRIKLVDFGLAFRVPYKPNTHNCSRPIEGYATDVSDSFQQRRLLIKARGRGSNWGYMSPEVVAKEMYFDGFAHDLWAAGVILYILLIGHKPFHWAHKSDKQFLLLCESGSLKQSLVYWDIELSPSAIDLLQNMLWRDPRRRLTLEKVMKHPWVLDLVQPKSDSGQVKEIHKSGKTKWFQKKKK